MKYWGWVPFLRLGKALKVAFWPYKKLLLESSIKKALDDVLGVYRNLNGSKRRS